MHQPDALSLSAIDGGRGVIKTPGEVGNGVPSLAVLPRLSLGHFCVPLQS